MAIDIPLQYLSHNGQYAIYYFHFVNNGHYGISMQYLWTYSMEYVCSWKYKYPLVFRMGKYHIMAWICPPANHGLAAKIHQFEDFPSYKNLIWPSHSWLPEGMSYDYGTKKEPKIVLYGRTLQRRAEMVIEWDRHNDGFTTKCG